jgi:spermidine synthase
MEVSMRLAVCFATALAGLFLGFSRMTGLGHQDSDSQPAKEPVGPYSKSGPVGHFFRALKGDPCLRKVGVLGLGTGALAAYSEPGQDWTFFEIDENVKKAAENSKRFRFLSDARGKIHIELGDERFGLQKSNLKLGLLVVDAFCADGIPVHLLTREALTLYRQRLLPHGLLVFHVNPRHLDSESCLAALASLAADAKWVAYVRPWIPTKEEKKMGFTASQWLVMAQERADLRKVLQTGSWTAAKAKAGLRIWTDDYSNLDELFRKYGGR